ncbi:MAG: RNA methyltransferase [Pseudomonadota bacterium]
MSNAASKAPGRIKEIDSPANPIIKDIRTLEKKRIREETNSFLAEGQKLVIDALHSGWSVRTLIVSKNGTQEPRTSDLIRRCIALGVDTLLVSAKVLSTMTRRDNPQTVCAVIERRFGDLADVAKSNTGTWIALDRVRDPGNLGTIIRTGDALGASGVIIIGDATDPFAMEAVRATMGSLFAKPIIHVPAAEFIDFAGHFSGLLVGTHLEGSVDFRVPNYEAQTTILLMGNEQSGLPPALVEVCDQLVRVPQAGSADSLNLAVATAICLFHAREHALALPGGDSG